MSGKLKKNIGFSLLPFAFLFLFEPGYIIFDPLPDFVGYIILSLSISNLSDINPRIYEALSGFKKGTLISFLRLVAIYLINIYFLESEQSVGMLIFSFAFSFFEMIVLIPAYRCLFEGLLSLGLVHNGNAVYCKKIKCKTVVNQSNNDIENVYKESKRNVTEKAYFLTVAFIIVRCLSMCLPEFTSLMTNSAYEFVGLLRVFGMLTTLVIGIVWLIKMISFCKKVKCDRAFIEELSAVYLNYVKDNPNYYTAKTVTLGISTLIVAFVISADFFLDYVNLIPNFLFYIAVIFSLCFFRSHSKKTKPVLILSIIGIFLSSIARFSSVTFHNEYHPSAVFKVLDAYYHYYRMLIYHIADSLLMIATVLFILLMLYDVYKAHSEMNLSVSGNEFMSYKKQFIRDSALVYVLSVAASLSEIYYVCSLPYTNTDNWFFYYSAAISVAINLLSVFAATYFIGFINNSVKYRYRSDI